MRIVGVLLFIALAGCATPPRVSDDLRDREEDVIAALREAVTDSVPEPPFLLVLDGHWEDGHVASVVAVEGPMLALRFCDPGDLEWSWELCVFSLYDAGVNAVVVSRWEELLLCRSFPKAYGSSRQPRIGDPAVLDHHRSDAVRDAAGWRE